MPQVWIVAIAVLLGQGMVATCLARDGRALSERQSQPALPDKAQATTDPAAEDTAGSDDRILRDFESPARAQATAWADGLFITNSRGARYDRVRIVEIDWFKFLRQIRSAPLYQQSSNGAAAPDESTASSNSFTMQPFSDRKYRMNLERVDVYDTNGQQGIVLMGSTLDAAGRQGSFRISMIEEEEALSGHINAPDGYTTFGPGPENAFHVFREVSQESRRRQMEGKSY